jgi:hypothetical protein
MGKSVHRWEVVIPAFVRLRIFTPFCFGSCTIPQQFYKGANALAPIFLSRRVKLIVTSERLNIFKKCFHQSKVE